MPPRARKTAAAKPAEPAKDENVSDETVTVDVDENTEVEGTEEETPKKRRGGRQASPLTAAIRAHEKATARLKKAEKKAAAVQDVADELAAAQAEVEGTKAALTEAINANL